MKPSMITHKVRMGRKPEKPAYWGIARPDPFEEIGEMAKQVEVHPDPWPHPVSLDSRDVRLAVSLLAKRDWSKYGAWVDAQS